ncbi:MAG TPA: F0F1 ATP synthase subunit delta [Candidatus Omnitrophota bacterium]|nr:F0F1 ATP synthase subunit delta [Candidatus Omnitrophota bacterium]HPS19600.1 F0F1 ATP synthase subunit delta [Candidatus Omnitrophota bacterium]
MFLAQLVIIQIIIFGVVIFLLKKVLYGDTESAMGRLDATYKELTQKKQEMADKMFEMEKEYNTMKEKAEKLAAAYKDAAEKEMSEKKDAMVKKAKEEAERIVTDAQNMKGKIREEIRKEEEDRMLGTCAGLINGMMGDALNEKMDNIFIEDFLDDFKKVDKSRIPAGTSQVEIITSRKVSDVVFKKISDALNEKMSASIKSEMTVDRNIVGGVILKFGSLVLDGSLASRIKEKTAEKMAR